MTSPVPSEIDVSRLEALLASGEPVAVLDVREPWERDICRLAGSLDVPLAILPIRARELPSDRPLVVLCHHGGRSAQATAWLRQQGFANATNLAGGIDAWARRIDPTMKVY